MRQSPGEHYEPCGRQLDGLLADQDRANDFRREIKRDARAPELESTDIEGTGQVAVNATLTSEKRREIALEYIVGRLSLEPSVTAARWRTVNTIV